MYNCPQHGPSRRLPSGLPECCVSRYRQKHRQETSMAFPPEAEVTRVVAQEHVRRGRRRAPLRMESEIE